MDDIGRARSTYAREVAGIYGSPGSTGATYYPAVQRLLTAVLRARHLPFEVRANTSQRRTAGGIDLPDLAFYDGGGDCSGTSEPLGFSWWTQATAGKGRSLRIAVSYSRSWTSGRHPSPELVETAVTEWSPIAEPESLPRILARQAKRAKADLPETFSSAVQPLLDDFSEALGLTFEGAEGEEFLRSSLIQTAFYGVFARLDPLAHSNERPTSTGATSATT